MPAHGAPPRPSATALNHAVSEEFEESAEPRIAGRLRDGAMKGAVPVDRAADIIACPIGEDLMEKISSNAQPRADIGGILSGVFTATKAGSVACAYAFFVSMEAITKKLWPFYGAMCLVLVLVTSAPELSLWRPRLFGR